MFIFIKKSSHTWCANTPWSPAGTAQCIDHCSDDTALDAGAVTGAVTSPGFLQEIHEKPSNQNVFPFHFKFLICCVMKI
jgi:hypothetical protein